MLFVDVAHFFYQAIIPNGIKKERIFFRQLVHFLHPRQKEVKKLRLQTSAANHPPPLGGAGGAVRAMLFLLLLCLFACTGKNFLYHENIPINEEVWTVENQLPFQFSIADTVTAYTVGLNLRYTLNFPKQNLYVFMHTTFPDETQTCDTVSIDLFTIDGTPFGKGKRIKELDVPIARIRFPMSGQYSIHLEHGMRDHSLEGIASMGLYIMKPSEK